MKKVDKRLSILSDLEEFAFYGFPDFNDEQRLTYFAFEDKEWELISKCSSLYAQVVCALQIGYFKAKQIFFSFSFHQIPKNDLHFILTRYFPHQTLDAWSITKYEYYWQREEICQLFGYKLWPKDFLPKLHKRAKLSVKRDISPNFIAHELLDFLQLQKIVRPGYSTLQKVISHTLTEERKRLKSCLLHYLTDSHREQLRQLLKNEHTLSDLSALKQDAKNFKVSMMRREIKKHDTLKPLQAVAQIILPHLDISRQNIAYYASLIHHYTIYELERFDEEQTNLYLLCYILQRYQQINDNLVEAFSFNLNKLEREIKAKAVVSFANPQETVTEQKIGKLLLLYVDDKEKEEIREKAFKILPKESIRALGEKMVKKPKRKQDFHWQERNKAAVQYIQNLR